MAVDILELNAGSIREAIRIRPSPSAQGMKILHHQDAIPTRTGVQGDIGVTESFLVPLSDFEASCGLIGTLLEFELLKASSRAHPCAGDGGQQRACYPEHRDQQCYDPCVHFSPAMASSSQPAPASIATSLLPQRSLRLDTCDMTFTQTSARSVRAQ
ncbi:hypothetical protein [Streptomyces sp. NPDC005989]|uniref:hypothetical protein n=1 Tax=Streptomyces sp. NPDC005989 TaxID=3156727 RepID=UPI003411213E